MKSKFLNAEFGYCPRVLCDRQIVLPIAMSEDLSISRVKIKYITEYISQNVEFVENHLQIKMF